MFSIEDHADARCEVVIDLQATHISQMIFDS